MSRILSLLEHEVHHAALGFMILVNGLRLVWMARFRSRRERSRAIGREGAGIVYSLAHVVRPRSVESARRNPGFYVQFILFHAGVAAAILLTFLIPYAPGWMGRPWIAWPFRAVLAAAFLTGLMRFVRRLTDPAIRLISTADDYFSLGLVIVFFGSGFLALLPGFLRSDAFLLAFFGVTVVFLVYEPFSKIIHYLYYPFTHFFLGRSLGRRGVYPVRPDVRGEFPEPGRR